MFRNGEVSCDRGSNLLKNRLETGDNVVKLSAYRYIMSVDQSNLCMLIFRGSPTINILFKDPFLTLCDE